MDPVGGQAPFSEPLLRAQAAANQNWPGNAMGNISASAFAAAVGGGAPRSSEPLAEPGYSFHPQRPGQLSINQLMAAGSTLLSQRHPEIDIFSPTVCVQQQQQGPQFNTASNMGSSLQSMTIGGQHNKSKCHPQLPEAQRIELTEVDLSIGGSTQQQQHLRGRQRQNCSGRRMLDNTQHQTANSQLQQNAATAIGLGDNQAASGHGDDEDDDDDDDDEGRRRTRKTKIPKTVSRLTNHMN